MYNLRTIFQTHYFGILLTFLLFSINVSTAAEPQRPIYLPLDSLQLTADEHTTTFSPPFSLQIKIEPPGTAGLVVDRTQSYLQRARVKTSAFPHLDPAKRYVDESGERIDLSKLTDYRPYMDNFPLIFSKDQQPMEIKNRYHKIYFGGYDATGNPDTLFYTPKNQRLREIQEADQLYELHLVWFDAKAQSFYQSILFINGYSLFHAAQNMDLENPLENLLVSLHTEGRYTLWLTNDLFEIQVDGEFLAEKIPDLDWQKFRKSLPDPYQNSTQRDYITAMNNLGKLPYLDEMFSLKDQNDRYQTNLRYKVVRDDDKTYCGITNSKGETKRINTGNHPHQLKLYYGTSCPKL